MKKPYTLFLLFSIAICANGLALSPDIYSKPISENLGSDRAYDDSQRRGAPSTILVWDQNLQKSQDGRYQVSATPKPFTNMAVLWRASHDKPEAGSFSVLYRVREKEGSWTDFRKVYGEYHPSEVGRDKYVGELILLSDTQVFDSLEVIIIAPEGVGIERIEIDLTDITRAHGLFKPMEAEVIKGTNKTGLQFPSIIRRSEWCQTGSCHNPTYAVSYINATHSIIHYGAAPDSYTSGAAVVFSYWNHHVNTNGWNDIGYNYLVDRFGNLFEGRHNPNLPNQDVRAAHAGASNPVSIGVNFLGNTDALALRPTTEQLAKNAELLAWWYNHKSFDPTSSASIILQDPAGEAGMRPRILGHKDVGNTACPGVVLFGMIPQMRLDVLQAMNIPDFYSVGSENLTGQVGNFPSLRAAVAFLNGHTFVKDVIMYITSDLLEDCTTAANPGIGLAVDPSPHKITFKPAPGKTPTVTFEYFLGTNPANEPNAGGPSGAFVVGIDHPTINWLGAKPTRNIIFDGSNTPNGTTRDLTFTNTTTTHRNGIPFLIVGDVSGVEVKNMNIYHKATSQPSATQVGFNGALVFRVNHNAATNNAPRNILVENNQISVQFDGVSAGYNGINVFRTASGSVGHLQNIIIKNNLIEGKANGLFLPWLGDGVEITNNEIKVNQNAGTGILGNSAIQFPVTLAGSNILVEANHFSQISNIGTAANVNMIAVDVASGGNYTIANNMFEGFDVTSTENHAGLLAGVRVNNASANVLLAYNTILLNNIANISSPSALVYEGIRHLAGNLDMRNNILVSQEGGFNNSLVNLTPLPTAMNHNLYFLPAGNAASLGIHNATPHTTLAGWRTATGMDANSLFDDPLFVSAADLKIQDFSPAKGAGTPIAGITSDKFGTTRNSQNPCIGAHENISVVFSNVYSIGTGSVEGQAGNFSTFREAVSALNSQAVFTQDVYMFITSDLVEDCTSGGIGLAVDPSPYTITFKPAPGVSPTVAFNYPADANSGPSGAFIIGIPHTNNIAWADAKPTKNIVFDGSNTPGGETRDMTFTNTTGSHRNGMPFAIIGDVENVTIKNLKIYHRATNLPSATQAGFNGALSFRVNHNAATNNAPRNILVENNHISVDFQGVSPGFNGINVFRTASGSVGHIQNITIKNNLIEGKANGMFLAWYGDNISITGNEIRVNQDIGQGILAQAAIQFPLGLSSSNVSVTGNRITRVSNIATGATVNMAAIDIVAGGNFLVANNMIFGFQVTAPTGHAGFLRGIRVNNASAIVNFVYNSMLLNNLTSISGATSLVYEGVDLVSGSLTIRNNIFETQEPDFAHNLLDLGVLPTAASNNLYFFTPESLAAIGLFNQIRHVNLALWQAAINMDTNSVFANPLFLSSSNLKIQDASPAKGAGIPVAEVEVDIFGTPRSATNPCIGAHENTSVPQLFKVTFIVKNSGGQAVTNAVISLAGNANPAGNYVFNNVPVGTHPFSVTAPGYFVFNGNVTIEDANVNENVVLAIDNTSVEGIEAAQKLKVYPNPARHSVNLVSEKIINNVRIFDMGGREVFRMESINTLEYRVDVSGLVSGIYMVRVEGTNWAEISRLIISN